MPCFYCGKRVSLVRQLTDADFCSDDHRKKYHELTKMALSRLVDSGEQMGGPAKRAMEMVPPTWATERPAPVPEARQTPFPEERRIPAQEERQATALEDRLAFAPERREPIIVPPPAPPPPPQPVILEPNFEGDFVLRYLEATSPDVFLLMGGAAEWHAEEFSRGRFGTVWASASMRRCGPVWPKFDQDKLKRPGRSRPMAASSAGRGFSAPALRRSYARRWPPNLAAGGPGAGTLLSYPERPTAVAGSAELRAPIAELVASRERINLTGARYHLPRPAFPSGGLDESYLKPHFLAMAAELFAEHPPEFQGGDILLPHRLQKAVAPDRMPACGLLAFAEPARANLAAAVRGEVRAARFAQPGMWLPESNLTAVAPVSTSTLERLVGGWIQEAPLAIALHPALQTLPAPRRAPRPTIPWSPGWTGFAALPVAEVVAGSAPRATGTRRAGPAMTRPHEAAAFGAKLLLPAAGYGPGADIAASSAPREAPYLLLESPGGVRALEKARYALALVEPAVQPISLPWRGVAGSTAVAAPPDSANLIQLARPTALARLRVQDAGVWYDSPLFEAATPLMPEPGTLGAGFAGVPIETAYLTLALPGSMKGQRPGPMGGGRFSLAGSSAEVLLPVWISAPALPGLLELAPSSLGGVPSPVRPTPIAKALARDSAPASFQAPALLTEAPEQALRLEVGEGDFSRSPLVPVVRSAAPQIAGGRVPLSPAEPFHVLPVAAPDLACSMPVPQAIPGATKPASMAGRFVRAVAPAPDFAAEVHNVDAPRRTELQVREAEYAGSGPVPAKRFKSNLLSEGPQHRESEILLLSDGTLAKTTYLAPAVGVFGPPKPIAGAIPKGLADFTPSIPAAADPELASAALALAEQVAVPSADLQWFGTPAVRKRPAQPRGLPRAEMPEADLSMVGLAAPTARHTLEEMAIFPASIGATARATHPADSLRQDLPIPETHLPALGPHDREHLLGTTPAFQAPLVAVAIPALRHPPAGFVSRKLSTKLPESIAFPTTLSLGAGEPSGLGVRATTWTSDSHSLGWTAFPPNEVLVADSRATAVGIAMVVSLSGLETLERPVPKRPRAAAPLATQTAFPLGEPIQPATAEAEASHELQAVPPATLAPAVFRGAPQSPRKTSAEILAQPVGLPGFDLGISARLFVANQGLEAPAPARLLGASAPSDAHRVAAPISLSDEIHGPEFGLGTIHPLALASTGILGGLEFHAPRQVAAAFKPAAGARFPLARPKHAQSQAIEARQTLDQSPPWSCAGRTQLGTLRVSTPAVVGMLPRTAELEETLPTALAFHRLAARWDKVSGIETLQRPVAKAPRAAAPLATQSAFPLAEPIQPASADEKVSHKLQAVPPASVPPAVFRGAPQSPRKTSAEILAQPVGLPGFDIGITARLFVANQDLEAPAPARKLGAAALGDARRVAAPIYLSDEIHAPEFGRGTIHPLALASTGILGGREFHAPRQVAAGFKPAPRARFPLARPKHAQSQAIAACNTLDQSPPWAGSGRTQLGTLKVSAPELVGMLPRTAELEETLPTALAFHRLAARWDKVSGIETLQRPVAKAPRTAAPLATQTAFPLAEPIQPAAIDGEAPHELQAVPPASVPPAVFRGAPQAPWRTSAEILAQPVGLPGFDIGITARLFVANQDLEAPTPARKLGAAAPSDARRVAAPIYLSDEIHAPEFGLGTIHPLALSSTGILGGREFPAPRQVAAGFKPAPRARFRTARPRHAQSEAIAACHTLDQSPPWAGSGRTQLGTLKVSAPALVGMVPRSAELSGPMPVALPVHLMSSGSERVAPRTHAGATRVAAAGWQAFEGECTAQHFQSIESRTTSLQWPTPASGWFQTEAKRAPFAGAFPIAPPRRTEFPLPEAVWPQSAGFMEALRPTHLAAIGGPPKREDARTARQKAHLEPVFRPVRRPARLPVFSRAARKAAMPSGVFLYVEAHEDFDDYGTMGIAPRYEAPLPEATIPATGQAPRIRGNLELASLSLSAAPRLDLPAGPAGASGVQVTPPSPLLRDEIDPIPLEFDSEAAKGQGLMGALKNASRFFKFTTLTLFGVLLLRPQAVGVPKVYGTRLTSPVTNGGLVVSASPESLSYGEDSAPRAELSS